MILADQTDHVYIAMNTGTGHSMWGNDEYYHEHPSVNKAGKEFTHTHGRQTFTFM